MKIKNKNNTIDKSLIHSKIFQSLRVPDRNKQLKELQTNVINLRNSLGLLTSPKKKNKNKINRKKPRKSIIMGYLPKSMMMNNYYKEKQIKRLKSLENFIPQNKLYSETLSINTPNKDKNKLYMNKAFSLKRKNFELLQKMNKKNEIKDSYNNMFKINKNDIFMTETNLPDINNINKINEKNNSLRKVFTENNNYYENTINKIKYNKYKSHNLNYNIKDEIMRSSSDRNMLPPIRLRKEKLLKSQKDKNIQIKNSSNNNKLTDSLEKNLSTISNITIESKNDMENEIKDNFEVYPNKEKIKKSLTIEAEKRNNKRKKKIEKLNNQLNTIFGNSYHNKKEETENKDLINKINQIGKNFKNKKYTYDIEKWLMSSKFKYANWKYGIADINKYFIDMKEFGEQEEKELEMRKSFYEHVDRVINELKEDKEKRDLLNIEHKYGINIKTEEKKILKQNEYWNEDQANNKRGELCKVLKITKERKIREKQKRNVIEEILFQCKKGINNIINS